MPDFDSNTATILINNALGESGRIENLISDIQSDIDELNKLALSIVNQEGAMRFKWAEDFGEDWKRVYDSSLPEALTGMKASAENVKLTASEMDTFSNQDVDA